MTENMSKCLKCGSAGTVYRIPSLLRVKKNGKDIPGKPGTIVKEFIESTRASVEEQKYNFAREYESGD